MAARSGGAGRDCQGGMQQETLADRAGASWGDVGSVADRQSGWEWNRSQPCQGATELGFPGPTLGQMQSEAAGRAGEPSGQGEEASSEGLGGHHLLTQTDARCAASEVVGHHLHRQLGGVGGEAARLRDRRSLGILENPRVGGSHNDPCENHSGYQ